MEARNSSRIETAAAKRPKNAAHGASRGYKVLQKEQAQNWAKETPWLNDPYSLTSQSIASSRVLNTGRSRCEKFLKFS
jgi:hypothetical protein